MLSQSNVGDKQASIKQNSDIKQESVDVKEGTLLQLNPHRLPVFSGNDGKTDSSFAHWKFEVQCLMHDNTVKEHVLLQSIRRSVKGTAADVLLHLGQNVSVKEIVTKFDIVFGDIICTEQVLELFYSAKQEPKESVAMWGCRVEDYLDRAKKSGSITNNVADGMLRSKFWSGMTNVNVKQALRHHYDSDVPYNQLFKFARSIENEFQTSGQKVKCQQVSEVKKSGNPSDCKSVSCSDDKLDKVLQELKKLDKRLTRLEKSRPQGRQCFCCGSKDHMIHDCPKKNTGSGNEGEPVARGGS